MEFTPIETAEAFEEAINSRISEVESRFDGYISPEEVEVKISERTADLNNKIAEITLNSAKIKVAHEYGLPIDFAERLSGSSEDEIRLDAENFAKYFTKQSPKFSGEPPLKDTKKSAFMEMINELNKN